MEARALELMTRWIRGMALPLAIVAFVWRGPNGALGSLAGSALAIGNWALVCWFCETLLRRGEAGGARLMVLLAAKSGFVCMVASILLRVFDPTGLLLGVSAMVLGIVGGALHAHALEGIEMVPPALAGEKD